MCSLYAWPSNGLLTQSLLTRKTHADRGYIVARRGEGAGTKLGYVVGLKTNTCGVTTLHLVPFGYLEAEASACLASRWFTSVRSPRPAAYVQSIDACKRFPASDLVPLGFKFSADLSDNQRCAVQSSRLNVFETVSWVSSLASRLSPTTECMPPMKHQRFSSVAIWSTPSPAASSGCLSSSCGSKGYNTSCLYLT